MWAATVGAVVGYLATDWTMDYPGEILVGSIFIGLVLGAAGYVVYRALKWVYSEDDDQVRGVISDDIMDQIWDITKVPMPDPKPDWKDQ